MKFIKQVSVLTLAFTLACGSLAFGETTSRESDIVEENYVEITEAEMDAKDSTRAVKIFVETCEAVGADMPDMALISRDNVAKEMLDFAFTTIQGDVSDSEAKEITVALLDHIVANLHNDYMNKSTDLINDFMSTYLEKVASVTLGEDDLAEKLNVTNATVEKVALDTVIKKANSRYAWVQNELKQLEKDSVVNDYSKVLSLVIEEDVTTEFKFNEEQVTDLQTCGTDVVINFNSTGVHLPSELIASATKEIVVKKSQLVDTVKRTTEGGQAVGDSIYQLDVSVDEKPYEGALEIAMPLGKLDSQTVVVGEYKDEAWKKLRYTLKHDVVSFNTEGNHVYGLLTFKSSFSDLELSEEKYVLPMVSKGFMTGMNDTTFDPNGTMTRAEFTEMMVNYLSLEGDVTVNFKDVETTSKYYDAIGIAGLNTFTVASENGEFRPYDSLTKEEAVGLFKRAYELKTGKELCGIGHAFDDQDQVAEYADVAVVLFQERGLVDNTQDNFYPKQPITRGEIARMLFVFEEEY